ncbi:early transcribed membrane protein [Plasmodium ovale curtisi]|uniref:Early transcribed membrane protein n=1 Tax=Plasmodium ovale curtisi TaxID=864141 RepID=A0A1A8WVC0_PLAOA|nr:early transcribed membrane protein [Plasmodium ovale curtisi]SBT02239.1 early transcribed membrane protein [Plasmodium ovale curtisi]
MKITKIFYFVAFLLAIKVFVPGMNDSLVDAKAVGPDAKTLKKVDDDIARKQKHQTIMIISSIATGIALLLGGALGGYGYYRHKKVKGSENNQTSKPLGKGDPKSFSRSSEDVSKHPNPNTPKSYGI